MHTKIKSKEQAKAIGQNIKKRRELRNIRLIDASYKLHINIGQLSRFENGEFKFISDNLQIYLNYLQINDVDESIESNLIKRFTLAINKSPKHLETGISMVSFLESLDSLN